ncbi:MAG: galactose-phosphate uridylyltransferase [Acidimicrobiales bacterium]|nr:galactose-phosphate uridylyltransferase [Acidimicrobiales bacterium]
MNQLRLNPLTGRWVTVATGRASRPEDFAQDLTPVEATPVDPCPFCPGQEEGLPPALESYGPRGEWLLRVVPNKYPAFEGTGTMLVERLGPLFAKAPATGIHEVLVLTPEHKHSWADLDDNQATLVMAALRDRFEDHAHASGIRYSQAIVNHGRPAGASLAHPHGQLLGIPFVPGELVEEMAGFRRFQGGCLMCATVEAERAAGHRVVSDDDGVMVVAPWWSAGPFELLVIPEHQGHLRSAEPAVLAAVGRALRDALARMRDLLGDLSYNVLVHTLPHHASDPYHWHVHVVPRLHSVGGFEQGTGVPINIVAPEDASRLLAR